MYEDYIEDAIEMVSSWDLPPENFVEAVQQQAELMAGSFIDDRDAWLSAQFDSIRSH